MKEPDQLPQGTSFAVGWDKLREVITYLRSLRLSAGPGIRLQKYTSGILISATGSAAASPGGGAAADYDGMFRVSLDVSGNAGEKTLRVSNGFCYVNGQAVNCAEMSGLAPAAGYLFLRINRSGEPDNYQYSSSFVTGPDLSSFPVQGKNETTATVRYPIAQIEIDGESVIITQIHHWNPPILPIYGEC